MRLRPALMTCVIAALAVSGTRLAGIEVERRASARGDAQRELVDDIARDAAGLLVLTQDYGLHQSERAARQWALVHERLTSTLASYAATDADGAGKAGDMQDTARTLPQIFATLRTASMRDDLDALARRETLTDQLVNETRRVSDGAFELSRALTEMRSRDAVRQRWLAVIGQSTLLTLALVLAGLLLRRVLSPIDRLRGVAQAVEGGDLAARSQLPGNDELGQLSQALDAMTASLQQRDAALRESHQRLERNEAVLTRAMQAADAASAAKTAFLANMSHEIRTPMNAVMGLNFLLGRSNLDPAQRELVAKIGSASRSLLDVINAVLDLSKIEAGEMALEAAPFDPRALLMDVASLFQPQAEAKGIALVADLDAALPPLLLGDAARLRQIVNNLVANSIKFTAEGEVRLAARCPADEGAPMMLEMTVQDSGIGISAEALPRIFAPFMQAESGTSRRYGGTGLGLAIVKQLCQLMGGHISVNSQPGQGTRFDVSLPFELAQGLALPSRPLDLLLATTDVAQRDALQRLCADLGWRTELASDAAGLRLRLDAAPPDLVLLDHRLLQSLPTDEQAALQLRLAALPCVLMSRAAGATGLRLPADVSSLFDAVHATLAASGAAQPLLASTRDASALQMLPGMRVLVTDDSEINLEVARRILEQEGAAVMLAHDGAEAVSMLKADPGGFDAVLMDVQMPVLDGLAATRRIRAELGLQDLPILALTAGALLSERQRALDAGMNGFVSKPFDPASLVLLLRQRVEQVRGARLPVSARAPEVPADAGAWPLLDGIDRAEAQQRLMGDVEFFARLLKHLIDEFADLAHESSAPPDAALAARFHKLGGSAGVLAAIPLRDAARRGEAVIREGGDANAQVTAVRRQMAALLAQAQPWLDRRQAADAAARQAAKPAPAPPPDPQALERLRTALAANDLSALEMFDGLTPSLRAACGDAGFARLREAIGKLDYAGALRELSGL